ncbi:hypothetical protein AALP_AA3G028800 [Arabis alpina]|uniref:Uncharacterized protein n=1 Tax=Arabis alpina TaxID=50452 RepID=A0A087H6N2_ARAAL|nr:hypothetical protein AALP_AA3G028800 [Arabis alpina]
MAALWSITQPSVPLAGRVAIVTGSSCGIGRAIAIHLGARIVVNYTFESADAEPVAAEINNFRHYQKGTESDCG